MISRAAPGQDITFNGTGICSSLHKPTSEDKIKTTLSMDIAAHLHPACGLAWAAEGAGASPGVCVECVCV